MSYGHANNRDERRRSAIERLEKDLKKHVANKDKLEKTKTVLDNTQKNMGKGSSKLGSKE